jgi:hypothetical protein
MGISFLLHRGARIYIETQVLSQVQMHSWYVTEINALVSGSGNKKVTKKKINKITQKLLAIDQCEDGTLLLILE